MPNASLDFQSFSISAIPAFSDNYIWCLHSDSQAWVVDPGDASAVIDFLNDRSLTLAGILITHHHWDHTNGISGLVEKYTPTIYGPNNPAIKGITDPLKEGDTVSLFDIELRVIEVPGHTLDHIALTGNTLNDESILFSGDTLFSAGCGRLFEGTAEQMHHSLQKLAHLDDKTLVFCTHEYTESNLKFAQAVEPQNQDIAQELKRVQQLDTNKQPSLPSSIAKEKRINPFLRCHIETVQQQVTEAQCISADSLSKVNSLSEIDYFAAVRQWKDDF